MKILFLSNSFGALANFRYELIENLCADKNNELYLAFPFGEDTKKLDSFNLKYIDTQMTQKGKNPLSDFGLYLRYEKIISDIKPNIILSYTIKPNIYGAFAAKKNRIPIIISITGLGTALEYPGILQKITTFLYKMASKCASIVYFQNYDNNQFFIKHGIRMKASALVPGSGVNLNKFKVLPYPDGDEVHFVMITRVLKQKGIDEYIEAARYIRKKYPNSFFHVIGGCIDENYLSVLLEEQNNGTIIYEGEQSDIIKFHTISSCTIHPSYYPEGMSNVLLESGACGRPIITTDRSGCREAIEDGVNGYICKQQDSKDLICQIEKFLSLSKEQRKEMGLAGRRKIEKEFDREIVVKHYIDSINKYKI